MTVGEFKAWLEGFEVALGGQPPNADQWGKIKAQLQCVRETAQPAPRPPVGFPRWSGQMADGAIEQFR